MLVIGLHGWFLHPIAILLCDLIVYSEFLIHPVVLLSTSTRLRTEIRQTLQRLCQESISNAKTETYLCTKAILSCGRYHQRDHIYAFNKSPILRPSRYIPANHSIAQHNSTTDPNLPFPSFKANNHQLTSVVVHQERLKKVKDDDEDVVIVIPSKAEIRSGGRSMSRDTGSCRPRSLSQPLPNGLIIEAERRQQRRHTIHSEVPSSIMHLDFLVANSNSSSQEIVFTGNCWLSKPAVYSMVNEQEPEDDAIERTEVFI